ncbi:MAG: hypothetical protein ABEH64_08245 [Salinirussus sp.]
MSPDRPDGISRRKVLAAATGTGLLGAAAAGSTSAVVSDEVLFQSNDQQTGYIDLKRCWSAAGADECDPTDGSTLSIDLGTLVEGDSGSGSVRLRLPEDGGNNSAWLWLGSSCPARPCGPYRALWVTLWYDTDCDGTRGEDEPVVRVDGARLEDMRLCEALKRLAKGARLDAGPGGGAIEPLQPGQELCIGLEWRVAEQVCTVEQEEIVTLDFVAQQRRHRPEPESPWKGRVCNVKCGAECRDDCYPASFVAFCLDNSGDITKKDINHLSWTPDVVRWQTVRSIDSIVLKYGQSYELWAPEDGFDPGVEYEFQRGEHAITLDRANELDMKPQDPCPDWNKESEGCGVKYEFEEDQWDSVCGSPGNGSPGGGGGD